MLLNPWVTAGGLVVVLSLWLVDHTTQLNKLAMSQNADLRKSVEVSEANNQILKRALLNREATLKVLGLIHERTRSINTALAGQTAQLNRSLTELKRNDEKTNTYLAGLVPGPLGLRYARPDTTDPVAYRAGAIVLQPGAVPPTGTASPSK